MSEQSTTSVYLDYNATTPMDPRVLEAMLPYFTERFGNTMSNTHEWGWQADRDVEKGRKSVADILGCEPRDLTWTSGATESNNWAIQGVLEAIQKSTRQFDRPPHILASPVEHSSVLAALKHAEQFFGAEVEFLPISKEGLIDPHDIERRIKPETVLVAVMWVQNEIGSIFPIAQIGEICRDRSVYFLSDATQAIGKVPVDLKTTHVDLLSFSGHKLYGPKGIGFLYHRNRSPHVEIRPLIHGGGHELGERSGTLNVPGIIGLCRAIEIGVAERESNTQLASELRNSLWAGLKKQFPTARLNGPSFESQLRSAYNLNLTFPGQRVPEHIPHLAMSRGSACYSGKTSTSHVLRAIGLSEPEAQNTLRLSLGRGLSSKDIDHAIEFITRAVR